MRVAVIGTGYVAQAYLRTLHFLGYHPLVLSRSWIDYYNPETLRFCLSEYKPDIVINCAGYTGANTVDDCESRLAECRQANMVLPGSIAELCSGCKLIHISTGCMFDGIGPFTEESVQNFAANVYQITKLFGEQRVSAADCDSWIFRIRMPFNHLPHPRNWLMKLIKYRRILDGLNSVTFLDQFAMRSFQLVAGDKGPPGIYHACESIPVYTLAVAVLLRSAGLRESVHVYEPEEFDSYHVKRSAAVLDSSKFEKAYGSPFGDPYCAIRWCIERLVEQLLTRPREDRQVAQDENVDDGITAGAVNEPSPGSGHNSGHERTRYPSINSGAD